MNSNTSVNYKLLRQQQSVQSDSPLRTKLKGTVLLIKGLFIQTFVPPDIVIVFITHKNVHASDLEITVQNIMPCKAHSLLEVKIQSYLILILLTPNISVLQSCNFLFQHSNYKGCNISYDKTQTLFNPPILRGLIFRPQKEKSEELLTKKQDLSSTFNTTSVLAKGFYHTAAHYPTVPCLRETIILW